MRPEAAAVQSLFGLDAGRRVGHEPQAPDRAVVQQLVQHLEKTPASVVIDGEDLDGVVFIDGKRAGTSPLVTSLTDGWHTIDRIGPDSFVHDYLDAKPLVQKHITANSDNAKGKMAMTVDASNPEALDLASAYVIISGEVKKNPGPVETHKIRKIPVITLSVPPGEHVVDLVTPLTYATRACDVGPGEQRFCELQAVPRIDGNVVVSATSRRIDVKQDRKGNGQVFKRFELPAGKHRLIVKDRGYGCAPLTVTAGANAVAYSFIRVTEFEFKRCRTLDIKQHRLQFVER